MKKALLVLFATGWFLCGFAQEIEFETTVHDFGEVFHNAPAVYDFVFTNTGTEPLHLQKPKTSCGCLKASWQKEPIMPGKKGVITVTYDGKRVGNINKTATIASNATNSPIVVLRVKGTVLETELLVLQKNGKWGCEDNNGKVIIPFQYEKLEMNPIGFNAMSNSKWGVVDMENKIIVPFEYERIKISNNANHHIIIMKGGKWGIADNKTRQIIIPCEYDEDFEFTNIMSVKKGGRWGVINDKNKIIIPFEYDKEFDFAQTMTVQKGGKWGCIDNENKVIIPFEYDEKFDLDKSGWVKKGGKWGIIDKKNKVVIPFEYEKVSVFAESTKRGIVKKGGKWGEIDMENNTVIIPFEYEGLSLDILSQALYAKKNGKWGVIDRYGKTIILPFEYDEISEVVDAYHLKK